MGARSGGFRRSLGSQAAMGNILEIEDLSLTLRGSDGKRLPVLEDLRLSLSKGECLGIAGESGSGKSILAMTIMGLVPGASILERRGSVKFEGVELLGLSEDGFSKLRGNRMAMVFQEPMTSLNPLLTIGEQVGETIYAHQSDLSAADVEGRVCAAMSRAGFSDPGAYLASFPHQLSGGMRQRAMLAMSLVMEPDIIIADEPTTALDASLQVQLLDQLRHGVKDGGHALIFISHDLGVIRSIADRLAVLYAGFLVEEGPAAAVLEHPAHPYSAALTAALPRLTVEHRLPRSIPGHLPSPDKKPSGCVFSDRCVKAQRVCHETVPMSREVGRNRRARCLFPETVE
ncbi:MAG: ABC transporter ATP-binding protein [Candidatus Riflebacteria bacterium]|nr:ABC transporter ATP-binding protein [Candidatus Riflebacteria bacterium]